MWSLCVRAMDDMEIRLEILRYIEREGVEFRRVETPDEEVKSRHVGGDQEDEQTIGKSKMMSWRFPIMQMR